MPTRDQMVYFAASHSRGTQLELDAYDVVYLNTNGYAEFIGKSVLVACEFADLRLNWIVFAYLARKYRPLLKQHIHRAGCTVIWMFHEVDTDLDAFLATI